MLCLISKSKVAEEQVIKKKCFIFAINGCSTYTECKRDLQDDAGHACCANLCYPGICLYTTLFEVRGDLKYMAIWCLWHPYMGSLGSECIRNVRRMCVITSRVVFFASLIFWMREKSEQKSNSSPHRRMKLCDSNCARSDPLSMQYREIPYREIKFEAKTK